MIQRSASRGGLIKDNCLIRLCCRFVYFCFDLAPRSASTAFGFPSGESSLFHHDFWRLTRLALMRTEGCSNIKVVAPLGPVGTNNLLKYHPLALIPPFIPLFSSGGRRERAGIDASLLIRAQSVMQTQRLSGTGPFSILRRPRHTDNTTGLAGYWSANK